MMMSRKPETLILSNAGLLKSLSHLEIGRVLRYELTNQGIADQV